MVLPRKSQCILPRILCSVLIFYAQVGSSAQGKHFYVQPPPYCSIQECNSAREMIVRSVQLHFNSGGQHHEVAAGL